jgi:hypothetical protein
MPRVSAIGNIADRAMLNDGFKLESIHQQPAKLI